MQMLEVVVAAFVAWCLVAVEEVVVERDADGFQAVDCQLYAETLAGRSLATAAGSGNEHQFDAFAFGDVIGNLCYLLLL